jgi:uncharacterized protein involved in tellurium resistance
LTTTAIQVAIQGFPQFLGVIVGGAVTLIATIVTSNRQAHQASVAREEERKVVRDQLQQQVLFELQVAVRGYTAAIGRELREQRDAGAVSDEAEARTFEARDQQELGANRLRSKDLRKLVIAYRELCDETTLTFQQGADLMKAIRPILKASRSLHDAIGVELEKYL